MTCIAGNIIELPRLARPLSEPYMPYCCSGRIYFNATFTEGPFDCVQTLRWLLPSNSSSSVRISGFA